MKRSPRDAAQGDAPMSDTDKLSEKARLTAHALRALSPPHDLTADLLDALSAERDAVLALCERGSNSAHLRPGLLSVREVLAALAAVTPEEAAHHPGGTIFLPPSVTPPDPVLVNRIRALEQALADCEQRGLRQAEPCEFCGDGPCPNGCEEQRS